MRSKAATACAHPRFRGGRNDGRRNRALQVRARHRRRYGQRCAPEPVKASASQLVRSLISVRSSWTSVLAFEDENVIGLLLEMQYDAGEDMVTKEALVQLPIDGGLSQR